MSALYRSSRLTSQGSLRHTSSHMGSPASMSFCWGGPRHNVLRPLSAGTHRFLRCSSSSSSSSKNNNNISTSSPTGEASTFSSNQQLPNKSDKQQRAWKATMEEVESSVGREAALLALYHPIGFALWFNAFNIAPGFKKQLVYVGFSHLQDIPADDVAKWAGGCLIGWLLWTLGVSMLIRRYYFVKGVRQYGKELVESFLEEIKELPVTK